MSETAHETRMFTELVARAVALGATEAAHVSSAQIRVDKKLARLCFDPGCPNYGQSASCPPIVEGPTAFQSWVQECEDAIVIRIDIPISTLYSSQRREVMAFLHEIVSEVERVARIMGFSKSRAFAGGSCKELFCSSHTQCQYLTSDKGCRNPDMARPSMSGFGIDVGHLMTLAQWSDKQLATCTEDEQSMSWVAGLVLVG